MNQIKNIVLPFDFTEPAIAALEYAMKFVGYSRLIQISALFVNSVKPGPEGEQKTRDDFSELLTSLDIRTKLAPSLKIVEGTLPRSVLDYRKALDAELVIMGSMGDHSKEKNSTRTADLVMHANCPVITVPYPITKGAPKAIALVLGKEEIENAQVLGFLLHIARMFNAKVYVLTIYAESIYDEKVAVDSTEDSLEMYLEHFYVEHSFEKNKDVEKGIYKYLEDKKIDLLTIIPRNNATKTKPSEGRLTKVLTQHSTIPVLTLV